MEIEERDFYKHINTKDDFLLFEGPKIWELSLPPIPHSYRMSDVEMELSGEPLAKVFLFCRQIQAGIDNKVCVGEYYISSQCWVDLV